MSQVYSMEPATTGHVVFDTTHGPIDVNLWCKECPTTTRTFLQLCLDGYYDGMIFHRILSDFLIQTGLTQQASLQASASADDMDKYLRGSTAVSTKSSNISGDALRWDRKKLEVNPRIRFNHRGQVAMALPLEESNTNITDAEDTAMLRYQFFVTLDEAPFLDAKHVVFGTVAGSTMFNALRIGRTDADDQTGIPTDLEDAPPRIKCVKIDYHPFEDLVVTAEKKIPFKKTAGGKIDKGGTNGEQSTVEKRRKKRKQVRNLNILSFGDEERDYDAITSSATTSMKSSHDILAGESNFLSSKVDADVEKRSKEKDKQMKSTEKSVKTAALQSKEEKIIDRIETNDTQHVEEDRSQMRTVNDAKRNKEEDKTTQNVTKEGEERPSKRSKTSKSKKISEVEARRSKYSKPKGKGRQQREDDTMAKLLAFKTKVLEAKGSKNENGTKQSSHDDSLASRMAKRMKQNEDEQEIRNKEEEAFISMPGYSGQVNDDQADTGGNWMSAKFKCKQHADNATRTLDKIGNSQDEIGGDGRMMDDYVVLDEKTRGREKNWHHKKRRHR
ncbi:hypothetical protein ACHAWT_004779 [Skeletonema menzelii]